MAESGQIKNTATEPSEQMEVRAQYVTPVRRRNRAEHLMNKGIENAIAKHPLYSQDGKGDDADILVKYFNPYGRGRWYVLEGNKLDNGDVEFYGLVDMGDGPEYGYFNLSQLESYVYRMGNYPVGGIERDMYYGKKKVRDLRNGDY